MLSILRYIFAPKTLPVGSLWAGEHDFANPFREVSYRIAEVRDGWVRYEALDRNGNPFSEDSWTIRSFYAFYRQLKDQ